jgi:Penicillin-binding Protein dimerisation domain/PASTA domain
MARRSRLRTQRNKKRRLGLVILFLFLFVSAYWFFVNGNQVIYYVHTLFLSGREMSAIDNVRRGVIYDRNLKELAVSMDKVSVYATVRELDSLQETAMRLAPAVNKSEESLLEKLKGGSIQVWLAENISQDEEEAVRRLELKGIFLHREKVRYYPQKEKAAHFLGYTENQMGLAGVEYTYNQWLNQYGNSSRTGHDSGDAAKRDGKRDGGHNLILTIDLKIQDILYKYVTDIGTAHEGIRLGAMVMEAKSGNVIGCVNYPSYDPNRFREYKKSVLNDILVKPAAIPQDIRSFLAETASLQSADEKEGRVLPWSVASESMNLGTELRLWERLGLNEQLHLDFAAENDKLRKLKLLRKDEDPDLETSSVPKIATPIQLLTAMTRILNGGIRVTPHVVDQEKNPGLIHSKPGKPEPVVPGDVADEAQHLFQAMSLPGPLSSGTMEGDGLAFEQEGTVRDYLGNKIMLTMIPARGSELILMVVADLPGLDPGGSGKSGKVDLVTPGLKMIFPIVTLQQVLTHLSDMMTAEEKEKMYYQPAKPKEDGPPKTTEIHEQASGPDRMPDLVGLSLRKSLRLLKGAKIEIRVQGTGRVIAQDPPKGTSLADVKVCTLSLQPMVDKNRPGKELKKFIHKSESEKSDGNGKE